MEAPPPLSPSQLLDRLLVVHGVEREEDLRGKTPNSFRTVQRWKKDGWPKSASDLLVLLSATGLLRLPEEEADGSEAEHQRILLAGLATSVAKLAQAHGEAMADLDDVVVRLGHVEQALPAPRRVRAASAGKRKVAR